MDGAIKYREFSEREKLIFKAGVLEGAFRIENLVIDKHLQARHIERCHVFKMKGVFLCTARVEKMMSERRLADLMGVNRMAIRRWQASETFELDSEQMTRLLAILERK